MQMKAVVIWRLYQWP